MVTRADEGAPTSAGSTAPSIGRSSAAHDSGRGVAATPAVAPDAAAWSALRDAGLRGLGHALANRAGTVAAVAGMLAPDEPARPAAVAALQDGGERLLELVELFRLCVLPAADAEIEPVHVPTAVAEAGRLLAEHPGVMGATLALEVAPDAPPALGRPERVRLAAWALVAGAATAGALAVTVRVARGADGATVAVHVARPAGDAVGAPDDEPSAAARAAAFAAGADGIVTTDADGWTLTLPALGAR